MRSRQGIALISSLLLLTAIMAVGVGMLFLAQMNLAMAENVRSSALAEARADMGVDLAMTALDKYYGDNADFPATSAFTMPQLSTPTGTVTFAASDYQYARVSATEYTLSVLGKTANSGLYESEVLVASGAGSTQFPRGFVSEGVVKMNGNFETVNASIHGNGGFNLNGNATFTDCTQTCRDLTSTSGSGGSDERPVTAQEQPAPPASPITYTCSVNGSGSSGLCAGSTPARKIPKVTVGVPPYAAMRNDKLNDANNNGIQDPGEKAVIFGLTDTMTSTSNNASTSSFPSGCTRVTTATLAASYPSGSKICVAPSSGTGTLDVTIPSNANYSGVTMIVKGNVTISGSSTLTNVNLVSMGTLKLGGNANLTSSRLFADTAVDINGNFRYTGSTTVASGGSLDINGNIDYTGTGANIELALMSVGNMSVNGNSQTGNNPLRASLWSGRNMSLNGNTRLLGGASSVGSTDIIDLDINGNSYVDGRGTFTNTDLPKQSAPTVISRR